MEVDEQELGEGAAKLWFAAWAVQGGVTDGCLQPYGWGNRPLIAPSHLIWRR